MVKLTLERRIGVILCKPVSGYLRRRELIRVHIRKKSCTSHKIVLSKIEKLTDIVVLNIFQSAASAQRILESSKFAVIYTGNLYKSITS